MPELLFTIVAMLVGFIIIKAIVKSKNTSVRASFPEASKDKYYVRKYFFSAAEQSFYLTLKNILPDKYIVFAKTRMIDVIGANKYGRPRVIQKHIDFLITEKNKPLLAIELDDSSHEHKHQSDYVKDEIFESSGFPYLRIKCQRTYDTRRLSSVIQNKLETN